MNSAFQNVLGRNKRQRYQYKRIPEDIIIIFGLKNIVLLLRQMLNTIQLEVFNSLYYYCNNTYSINIIISI